MRLCSIEGCGGKHKARGYCNAHYQALKPAAPCSVEGCGKPAHSRGLCGMHYRRQEKTGSTAAPAPRARRSCAEPDCGKPSASRGLCSTHYAQVRRWGETRPLARMERPVVDGARECRKCGNRLPVAEFAADKSSKYGIKTACRSCAREEMLAWKASRPGYFTEWQRANADRMAAAVQKRRAARLNRESETISRLAVFQRDEYWCGICDGPIDAAAKWPAPRSASLDHIVPLNRGGTHTYGNVRAACFECNCRKGDRLDSELAL